MKARSPLGPIFLIVLVDVLSLTIMIPLLPFYAEAFGASPVTVTLLFTVFSACQLVSGPLLGNLSDRYGRRPLLLFSQAGMFASLMTLALADHLWMLFVGRIISGITAGNLTIAQAYITDHTRPEERTRAFGVIGIAFGIGFAIGPAISGLLSKFDPATATYDQMVAALSRPLFLAAGLSALSFVVTFLVLKEDGKPSELPTQAPPAPPAAGPPPPAGRRLGVLDWRGYVEYFQRPHLRSLLLQFFLFSVAFSIFISGFALFAGRRFTWDGHAFTSEEVGYVYAYSGVLGIIIQGGLLRRLSARYGDARLVTAGFFFSVVGYAVLGVSDTVVLLLACTTASAFGHGFIRPALTARVTHAVERHEQGVVLGLTQTMQALAMVIAPPIGGLLIEEGQLFWWAATSAIVSAGALALAARTR